MSTDNHKPRFSTKEQAETAIKSNVRLVGCTPIYIADAYAKSHGVERGGWYLYSRNRLPWCVA